MAVALAAARGAFDSTSAGARKLGRLNCHNIHLPGVASAEKPAELASDLSVAMLAVLERLAPDARAAFLLKEVFDTDYGDIAAILDKSEAACRQIVSRAAKRVRVARPRIQVSAAVFFDDSLFSILTIRTDGRRILDIYNIMNPDKLRRVQLS